MSFPTAGCSSIFLERVASHSHQSIQSELSSYGQGEIRVRIIRITHCPPTGKHSGRLNAPASSWVGLQFIDHWQYGHWLPSPRFQLVFWCYPEIIAANGGNRVGHRRFTLIFAPLNAENQGLQWDKPRTLGDCMHLRGYGDIYSERI
jgi:hypothetical protein